MSNLEDKPPPFHVFRTGRSCNQSPNNNLQDRFLHVHHFHKNHFRRYRENNLQNKPLYFLCCHKFCWNSHYREHNQHIFLGVHQVHKYHFRKCLSCNLQNNQRYFHSSRKLLLVDFHSCRKSSQKGKCQHVHHLHKYHFHKSHWSNPMHTQQDFRFCHKYQPCLHKFSRSNLVDMSLGVLAFHKYCSRRYPSCNQLCNQQCSRECHKQRLHFRSQNPRSNLQDRWQDVHRSHKYYLCM